VQKRVFFGCFYNTEPFNLSSFHLCPGLGKSNISDLFCYLRNIKSTYVNRGLPIFHSSFYITVVLISMRHFFLKKAVQNRIFAPTCRLQTFLYGARTVKTGVFLGKIVFFGFSSYQTEVKTLCINRAMKILSLFENVFFFTFLQL